MGKAGGVEVGRVATLINRGSAGTGTGKTGKTGSGLVWSLT